MKRYDVGDQERVIMTFTNLSGVEQDPTNVRFRYSMPDGTLSQVFVFGTDAEVVKLSDGKFYFDLEFTVGSDDAPWLVRWEGDGNVVASAEKEYWVRPQLVPIP